MSADPQSEFERIFGKTQKANEANADASPGPRLTQKLPGDSDLLGIRTDSDRFIVKNVPESLDSTKTKQPELEIAGKTTPEAMTIALNVNVFASIADAKKDEMVVAKEQEELSAKFSDLTKRPAGSADGPTFVIPLRRPTDKTEAANSSAVGNEFTRALNPVDGTALPSPNTEFTRVLHLQEQVQLPKASAGSRVDGTVPTADITITSDPKLPSVAPEAKAITQSGPSEFTKVVKGSEFRALQEKLAAAAASQSSAPAHAWQTPAAAPLPQYVPAPGTAWPSAPQQIAPQPSKLSQYMPLIIVLNVLVLMAILLIVFFALKK